MRKLSFVFITLLIPLLAFSLLSSSCKDSLITPRTGTLQISLTDAPAIFEAVNITFSEISAHIDGEWIAVSESIGRLEVWVTRDILGDGET